MTKSCGCLLREDRPNRRTKDQTAALDLTGQTVNQWRVIERDPADSNRYICECCTCAGRTRESVSAARLLNKRAVCCRLCSASKRQGARPHVKQHGFASRYASVQQQLTHSSWRAMITRVDSGEYLLEDGRPADMDPALRDIRNLVACVGLRPSRVHSLDRISNAIGYWPGNLRWEDKRGQALNRTSTVLVDVWNRKLSKAEWQEQIGLTRREFAQLLRSHPQRSDLTRLVLDAAAYLVQEPIRPEEMTQIDAFVDELMQFADKPTIPQEEV